MRGNPPASLLGSWALLPLLFVAGDARQGNRAAWHPNPLPDPGRVRTPNDVVELRRHIWSALVELKDQPQLSTSFILHAGVPLMLS